MLDEQQFQSLCDHAVSDLSNALNDAAENYPFEADMNNGALTIEMEEPPAKFVVSPNSPVKQIWVSAHLRSFKLDWVPDREAFVLADSGQTLKQLIASHISQHLGEEVEL